MKWPSGVPWCMTTTWSTTYVVEKCDVMWKLPHTVLTGGSERQLRKLTFGNDLSNYNVARWITEEMSYADFVAAGNLIAEYVLDNPVTQINGYIGIWDFKGFSFKHFLPFCSPKHIILLSTLMQDRFPARFKIAYCVNCSPLVNKAWSLINPVLKEKFRKR
ncbi:hypothetical protein AVEN_188221-1, partial [Araneus ventricosus]